ncbi:MAG: permease-like cell division protein FtsX [Oscillospiraceae bacterium]
MKRINTGYYLKEGFRAIFTHGFMSFAAVCMIVACLLIMGTFSLVAVNLEHNLTKLEDENEFLAYIDESLSEEEARALQSKIEAIPNVASATFISRGEAMESFLEKMNREAFEVFPESTYRHRYSIHVVDIEQLEDTIKQVAALPQIADYNAAPEVAEGMVAARNVAGGIAMILIAILFLISLFIIANTIKLATFSRREEIAIMKMCGATNAFIRWPFVFEGMILGLLGAGIAFLLQWGVYTLIADSVTASSGILSFIVIVPFRQMALRVLGIFAGAGFVVGVGGSLLAIRKFLQV